METLLNNEPVKRVKSIISKFDTSLSITVLTKTARTAKDAADSLNCNVGAIVKSLLFKVEKNFLICLVAGDKKCSLSKLKFFLNSKNICMANPTEVKEITGFSIGGVSSSRLAEKIQKVAGVLRATSPDALYQDLISDCKNPSEWVIDGTEPEISVPENKTGYKRLGSKRFMMLKDILGYLPDDILTKVDRASMSVSLETRVPFLDHELVEETFRVPVSMHLYGGKSKAILR
mgnify:CR=1 FL=1